MTGNEGLILFLRALKECGVPFMVVGGYSYNFWGMPRSTKDADIVVEASKLDWKTILQKLPADISLDEQITFETVTGSRRDILRIRGTEFFIEIFHLSDDPFNQQRFKNRVEVPLFPDLSAPIPRAEDVIIQKLRWFHRNQSRLKDFEDSVNILKVMPKDLDYPHLKQWCAEHGTVDLLNKAMEQAEE